MPADPSRVLLFHIAISSGHKMAALAVADALERLRPGLQTVCVDAMSLVKPFLGAAVKKTYLSVIKSFPDLWEYLYFSPEVYSTTANVRARLNRKNARTFGRFIDEINPEAIVCTQAYPCGVTAAYKRLTGRDIPLIGVVTDYVAHAYWFHPDTDAYMVPSEEVAEEVARTFSVDRSLLHVTGIPIQPGFLHECGDGARRRLGIAKEEKVILLMGGGNGLGSISEAAATLDMLDFPFTMVAVAGRNDKLYRKLRRQSESSSHSLKVLGYVDYVNSLMLGADLMITKPGGMTAAESLAAGLPLVLFDVIPGQEARNCSYLLRKGAAVWGREPSQVAHHVRRLLEDASLLPDMSRRAKAASLPDAAMDIGRRVLNMMDASGQQKGLDRGTDSGLLERTSAGLSC